MNARLTLEQLHEESEKDLSLKEDELVLESIRSPGLFSKYNKMLSLENIVLKKYEFEFKKAERHSWEYYSGKSDPDVYKERPFGHKILKGNIDKYLDSDPELEKIKAKLILQIEKVSAIERIMREINNRQWHIRNITESLKFNAGI